MRIGERVEIEVGEARARPPPSPARGRTRRSASSAGATNHHPGAMRGAPFTGRAVCATRCASSQRRFSRIASASASSAGERLIHRLPPARRTLGRLRHARRDQLPLGHRRRRPHSRELRAEGGEVRVARRVRASSHAERRAGRSPVVSIEARLPRRVAQERRRTATPRPAVWSRASRRRSSRRQSETPRLSGPGSGAVAHACCSESGSRFRNSPDVPRAGDVHGHAAGGELLIDVADLRVGQRRRETVAKEIDVELEAAPEARIAEGAARAVIGEQRARRSAARRSRGCAHSSSGSSIGKRAGAAARASPRASASRHCGPRRRRRRDAGGAQQVGAIEHHARVDVPRHAEQRVVDDVRRQHAGEIVGARNDAPSRAPRARRAAPARRARRTRESRCCRAARRPAARRRRTP